MPLYPRAQAQQSNTSSSTTSAAISAATTSTVLLAANPNRKGATITNDSTATLSLDFDSEVSSAVYAVQLLPGDYFELPYGFTGALSGIWSAANGSALVREFV